MYAILAATISLPNSCGRASAVERMCVMMPRHASDSSSALTIGRYGERRIGVRAVQPFSETGKKA